MIPFRQADHDSEGRAAGNDRYLVHRIMLRNIHADDRVAGFVVRRQPPFVLRHDQRSTLRPENDLVLGLLEILHHYVLAPCAGGPERRLVDEIRKVRSGEPRRAPRQRPKIDVIAEPNLAPVNDEDGFPALQVRQRNMHAPVKPPRAHQCRVQNVRPVGGGDDYHAVVAFESVHFNEQLIQSLLSFIVAAADADSPRAANRIDLVDEHDARRALLRLLEHVAHAGCAHADEHFNEVRSRYREERHVRFAGDRAREQGFPGSRRPDEQGSLWYLGADPREQVGVSQEFDDFLELLLRLVDARDVGEGRLGTILGQKLRSRFPVSEHSAGAVGLLAHEIDHQRKE